MVKLKARRDRPDEQLVREPVSVVGLAVTTQLAVAIGVGVGAPEPAAIADGKLVVELFCQLH
jgi:hypothetical protein